jgi:hypothetical protein
VSVGFNERDLDGIQSLVVLQAEYSTAFQFGVDANTPDGRPSHLVSVSAIPE